MVPPPGPPSRGIVLGVGVALVVGGCPGAPLEQPAPPAAQARAVVRRDALVTPAWVAERAARPKLVVLDVEWNEPRAYRAGHVPGAVAFDTNLIERAPLWRLVPDAELKAVAERFGITRDTTVVLYGAPTMAAARVAVALLYLGVEDVRLMDGGLGAWRAAGLPVEAEARAPKPVADFGAPVPGRPDLIVHTEDVRALLDDPRAAIVCTRSRAEHEGEVSGYASISAKGRIRGSVWGRAGSSANAVEALEREDGTLRDPDDLALEWSRLGVDADDRVVFYCGTGWRASLALFQAWRLGWERVSLYDPGWFEWGADPSNPVEAGPPAR